MKRLPGMRVRVVLGALVFWPPGAAVSSPPPVTPTPTPVVQRTVTSAFVGSASNVLNDVHLGYDQLESELNRALQRLVVANEAAYLEEAKAVLAALAQQIQKTVELKKKVAEIMGLLSTAERETAARLLTDLGNFELKAKTERVRISKETSLSRAITRTPTRPPVSVAR